MSKWIDAASSWLWGYPMLSLVLGVGVLVAVRLEFVQITGLPSAIRGLLAGRSKDGTEDGDVSPFAALMTAVGGIVGNGNIAGVATAVVAGGPGALFWMWVSALLGGATMFAESLLGVRYRKRDPDGSFVGGPMYYMRDRLGWGRVAVFFAGAMALKTMLATTTVQSNSIASVLAAEFEINPWVSCALTAVVTGFVILGGVKSIGRVSEVLTPFMGVLYLGGAAFALIHFIEELPRALGLVFEHAFTPVAAVGGFMGAGVMQAFRYGLARGVYSNEAGTGSVPIAHASAKTHDPILQGKVAMLGVFLDTLVVASATGLVLLASGAWTSGLDSTALTAEAFGRALGGAGGPIVVAASLLFGISTLITWAFYGEQCSAFLFGPKIRKPYRMLYCFAILGGALAGARAIWAWADLLNGLIAIPNLIALVALSGEVARTLKENRGST